MRTIQELPQLTILCSERFDGDFRGENTVSQHLKDYLDHSISFTHLHLEHGSVVARPSMGEKTTIADAGVVVGDGQGLSMVVGDCFPIILVDQEAGVVAMIHGGWRSLAAGIIQKTLNVMEQSGAQPNSVWAWIGPGARSCCYRSVDQPTQINEHDWSSVIEQVIQTEQEKNGSKVKWKIDLPRYINQVLLEKGIKKKHIFDDQGCTVCQPELYFSHQRSKLTGDRDGRFLVAAYWHPNSTT